MAENLAWRKLWTIEPHSRTAVHVSGVMARVQISPEDPSKDRMTLDFANVSEKTWDLGLLSEEATELVINGEL